jgi:hypothetical protein
LLAFGGGSAVRHIPSLPWLCRGGVLHFWRRSVYVPHIGRNNTH